MFVQWRGIGLIKDDLGLSRGRLLVPEFASAIHGPWGVGPIPRFLQQSLPTVYYSLV